MAIYPQTPNDWLRSQAPTDQRLTVKDVKFEGIELNESGTLVSIPVVYGQRRVTGPRVFTSVKSDNMNVLYTVVVLSEGPITNVSEVFLNDVAAFTNQTPFTTGTLINVGSGPFGGVLSVEFRQGFSAQLASTLLTEVSGRQSDIQLLSNSLDGMAYMVLKMTHAPGYPSYNEMPKISANVSGRRLRNSSTNGFGQEQNVFRDANPADVLLDVLTNGRYGRGLADSRIDQTTITALRASLATTLVPHVNGQAIARGQCNLIMDTSKTVLDNVNNICRQFGIIFTLANGKYRFVAEYSGSANSGSNANSSSIVGSYSETIPDLSVKYNRVEASISNGLDDFTAYVETIQDLSAQTVDGKVLDTQVNFDAITNPYLARFAAETILRKSRGQRTFEFVMTKQGFLNTVGDIMSFGPTGATQVFIRLIEITVNDDFTVSCKAVTHNNSFYPPFVLGDIWNKPKEIAPTPIPQPYPDIRPVIPSTGTLTVGTGITLTGTRGTEFYTVPFEIIRSSETQFSNANYRPSTVSSFSTNTTGNNTGVSVRVFKETLGTKEYFYYWYQPYFTNRLRDLGNATLGGEGAVVALGSVYTKIYYVYQIGTVGSLFGWHSKRGTDQEFCFFDPDQDFTVRQIKNGVTFEGLQPQQMRDSGGTSLFGMPFVTYSPSGFFTTDIGMKFILANEPNGPASKPWLIPPVVWNSKQGLANTQNTADKLMTIKYFVIANDGSVINLAHQKINLMSQRAGDSNLFVHHVQESRTNYLRAKKITAPF